LIDISSARYGPYVVYENGVKTLYVDHISFPFRNIKRRSACSFLLPCHRGGEHWLNCFSIMELAHLWQKSFDSLYLEMFQPFFIDICSVKNEKLESASGSANRKSLSPYPRRMCVGSFISHVIASLGHSCASLGHSRFGPHPCMP
jgi:hypothetical protein